MRERMTAGEAVLALRRAAAGDEAFLHELYAKRRHPEAELAGWPAGQWEAFVDQQFRLQQAGYRDGDGARGDGVAVRLSVAAHDARLQRWYERLGFTADLTPISGGRLVLSARGRCRRGSHRMCGAHGAGDSTWRGGANER